MIFRVLWISADTPIQTFLKEKQFEEFGVANWNSIVFLIAAPWTLANRVKRFSLPT
jgi:hypothetical protein